MPVVTAGNDLPSLTHSIAGSTHFRQQIFGLVDRSITHRSWRKSTWIERVIGGMKSQSEAITA
jgi:hypothetical protein